MITKNDNKVNGTIGYYSIIQYSTSRIRKESVNVGVVLLVPNKSYIKSVVTHSLHKVSTTFNIDGDTKKWLMRALDTTQIHIHRIVPVVGGLNKYIKTRMNEITMTDLFPIKIKDRENLDHKLINLYNELVN